jgi:hypothetical protein
VPRLRRCLVFLDAIDALTRAAIACRVFDAKHIRRIEVMQKSGDKRRDFLKPHLWLIAPST